MKYWTFCQAASLATTPRGLFICWVSVKAEIILLKVQWWPQEPTRAMSEEGQRPVTPKTQVLMGWECCFPGGSLPVGGRAVTCKNCRDFKHPNTLCMDVRG